MPGLLQPRPRQECELGLCRRDSQSTTSQGQRYSRYDKVNGAQKIWLTTMLVTIPVITYNQFGVSIPILDIRLSAQMNL